MEDPKPAVDEAPAVEVAVVPGPEQPIGGVHDEPGGPFPQAEEIEYLR